MSNKFLCVDVEHDNGKLREIGVVRVDVTEGIMKIISEDSWLIYQDHKASANNFLSDHFVDLTGISREEFKADSLPEHDVIRSIHKKYGITNPWYAWGSDDDMVGHIFGKRFIDYGTLWRHVYDNGPFKMSHNAGLYEVLPQTLNSGLKRHRALDDAKALARLMLHDISNIRSKK